MGDFCVSLVSKMLTYAKYAPLFDRFMTKQKGTIQTLVGTVPFC